MSNLLPHIVDVLGAVPKPGEGTAPPGFEKFTDIMSWVKWISLGILVMALMVAGVRLAVAGRTGDGGEHVAGIGRALGGVIIVSAAFALVSGLAGGTS